jgi:tetratricopeptide (TPR) repeat protein
MRTVRSSSPLVLAAILSVALAAACSGPTTPPAAAAGPRVPVTAPPQVQERFEWKVRADFFAGLEGDTAAFARAMKACDDALASRPDDPEALVWRGAGRLWESGLAYRSGDMQSGRALWDRALAEMDRAVAVAPDAIGVRIPRGAALLGAAPHVPDPAASRSLYERAAADYEVALRLQEPTLGKLSTHAREELLFGLADVQAHLGDTAKARSFFERLVRDCPDSRLVPYAQAWLSGAPPDSRPPCAGCHSG